MIVGPSETFRFLTAQDEPPHVVVIGDTGLNGFKQVFGSILAEQLEKATAVVHMGDRSYADVLNADECAGDTGSTAKCRQD